MLKFGAFSADLAALAHFCPHALGNPASGLPVDAQALIPAKRPLRYEAWAG